MFHSDQHHLPPVHLLQSHSYRFQAQLKCYLVRERFLVALIFFRGKSI